MNPKIIPGKPVVVACGPPGENRWGFYQFPDMWRAPGKELYLAINVGHDCLIGQHEPSRFYVSRDDGNSWQNISYEEVDKSPDVYEFSDGSQVSFGLNHYIYHVQSYGPYVQQWQFWDMTGKNIKPASGMLMDAYDNQEWLLFRYEDIPDSFKQMPFAWRKSKSDTWQKGFSSLHAPELLLGVVARAWWWDEKKNHIHEDMPLRLLSPWPRWGVTVLSDDTLLWPHYAPHPESERLGKLYCSVVLFASTDRGRNWHKRAMIADDTDLTTDGYSGDEHWMQRLPNGDLFCVMRTVMGDRPGSTMYLAGTRSTDNGFTWSKPYEIAPFSVTPILMSLENKTTAVVYGRPGVYVRASGDNCHTWTTALPVVGPTEEELLKDRWWDVRYDDYSGNKISCGNLGAVVTGPDRFLLAYSDFRHKNEKGEQCKAVITQEFIIEPS